MQQQLLEANLVNDAIGSQHICPCPAFQDQNRSWSDENSDALCVNTTNPAIIYIWEICSWRRGHIIQKKV